MPTQSSYTLVTLLDHGVPREVSALSYARSYGLSSTPPNKYGRFVKPAPYFCQIYDYNVIPITGYQHNDAGTVSTYLGAAAWDYNDQFNDHRSIADVLNRALINTGNAKMTLGETMGEAKSSFKMIAKNATALYNMFKKLKHGDIRGAARAVGLKPKKLKNIASDASNRYLELIFGWRPLVEEVYKGIEVIHKGLRSSTKTGYITGYAASSFTLTREPLYADKYGKTTKFNSKFGCHAKYNYSFTHPSSLYEMNQLGILNPVSLVWNLTGSSFVYDWFLPIGNYLDAFSSTIGLTFEDAYYSTFTDHHVVASPVPYKKFAYTAINGVDQHKVVTRRTVVSNSTPFVPTMQLPSGISKATTAVALLTQFLSSGRNRP